MISAGSDSQRKSGLDPSSSSRPFTRATRPLPSLLSANLTVPCTYSQMLDAQLEQLRGNPLGRFAGNSAIYKYGNLRMCEHLDGLERVNDFDTAGGRSLGSEFWFL